MVSKRKAQTFSLLKLVLFIDDSWGVCREIRISREKAKSEISAGIKGTFNVNQSRDNSEAKMRQNRKKGKTSINWIHIEWIESKIDKNKLGMIRL